MQCYGNSRFIFHKSESDLTKVEKTTRKVEFKLRKNSKKEMQSKDQNS